jgi:hypothetical protein
LDVAVRLLQAFKRNRIALSQSDSRRCQSRKVR